MMLFHFRRIAFVGLCLILVGSRLADARQPPPSPPELRSGRVSFTFLQSPAGPPHAEMDIQLLAPYPRARPIRARTDADGRVVLESAEGQYLLLADENGIGLVRFRRNSPWSECDIILPINYPFPPVGRPDLVGEDEGGRLVLTATQKPVETPAADPAPPPDLPDTMRLNDFLERGLIREGLERFADPTGNEEIFSLAILQALDGFQSFLKGLDRFNYHPELGDMLRGIPFLRFIKSGFWKSPVETATPEKIAALFTNLRSAIRRANATVAAVNEDEFNAEVNLSQIRLNTGNRGAAFAQPLAMLFDLPLTDSDGNDIVVRFDSADAKWLQGYTHVIGGMLDLILAYEWRPLWDYTAHLVFTRYEPQPLMAGVADPGAGNEMRRLADWIAVLHAMRLEVADPDGIRRVRDEFKAMVACSRISWQRIMAETDDDMEWIPSPTQAGPGGARISREEVDGWLRVLDEMDDILDGRLLLPHWRMLPGMGINVERMVSYPPRLDPFMLLQGNALAPYVESGNVSDRARWLTLTAPFGARFGLFALWVN